MPKHAKRPGSTEATARPNEQESRPEREPRFTYERPAATVWRQALLALAAGAFLAWLTFLIVLAVQG